MRHYYFMGKLVAQIRTLFDLIERQLMLDHDDVTSYGMLVMADCLVRRDMLREAKLLLKTQV